MNVRLLRNYLLFPVLPLGGLWLVFVQHNLKEGMMK
jgi:hypothetical protein